MSLFRGSLRNGKALRVAIGGTAMDLGGASGIAPPSGYLVPNLDRNGFARGRNDDGTLRTVQQIATTAAHEAAHMYGANYHYIKSGHPCAAQASTGLDLAHLAPNSAPSRDKWWSARGFGVSLDGMTTFCHARADVAILRATLGSRAPLVPADSINVLQADGSRYLRGAGVVRNNQTTRNTDEFVEACVQHGDCDYQPVPTGYVIGRGENQWWFQARRSGSVRIRVNTINKTTAPGSNTPIDATSANLDANFQLWRATRNGWTQVVSDAARQSSDRLSAEYYLQPPSDDFSTYVVSVGSREAYGDLGQYTVEVYAGNANIREYSQALRIDDLDLKDPVLKVEFSKVIYVAKTPAISLDIEPVEAPLKVDASFVAPVHCKSHDEK